MDSDFAHELPPLRQSSFHLPHTDGLAHHYLCGNSLGLQPKRVAHFIDESLHKWRTQAVEGHFTDPAPWMDYHQLVRDDLAKLVGAKPIEVVAMNSLSVNLHLLLTSFYRPTPMRHKILIESRAFPSDHHIVASQIRLHGLDPATTLLQLPCDDAGLYAMDNIVELLSREGEQIALVLLPGVQYVTGQAFDLQRITRAAKAAGCVVGFDLAHAVGNIQVDLHAIGCDFAAWCSYKYLNAGPGAVAGAFVHERHANAFDLPRLSGWWGHDPASRFLMAPEFIPTPGADGWQLSNPPIFALAPLRASLEIFRDVEWITHRRTRRSIRFITARAHAARRPTARCASECARAIWQRCRSRAVCTFSISSRDWRLARTGRHPANPGAALLRRRRRPRLH
jgi:kynureninase